MDQQSPILRTINVTRYVVPLREGGSLPAIVEAADGFLYVLKFRGAGQGSGPIGQYDMASRFRLLTATRSTVVQTSKVHPGFCNDPEEAIQKLFKQLVL